MKRINKMTIAMREKKNRVDKAKARLDKFLSGVPTELMNFTFNGKSYMVAKTGLWNAARKSIVDFSVDFRNVPVDSIELMHQLLDYLEEEVEEAEEDGGGE